MNHKTQFYLCTLSAPSYKCRLVSVLILATKIAKVVWLLVMQFFGNGENLLGNTQQHRDDCLLIGKVAAFLGNSVNIKNQAKNIFCLCLKWS